MLEPESKSTMAAEAVGTPDDRSVQGSAETPVEHPPTGQGNAGPAIPPPPESSRRAGAMALRLGVPLTKIGSGPDGKVQASDVQADATYPVGARVLLVPTGQVGTVERVRADRSPALYKVHLDGQALAGYWAALHLKPAG